MNCSKNADGSMAIAQVLANKSTFILLWAFRSG
jgi:hypothetical protein